MSTGHVNSVIKNEQKEVSEYDKYAKRSFAFCLITPCLLFVLLWLLGWLTQLSIRINSQVAGYIVLAEYPLAVISIVVLSLFGIIVGKKGLSSNETRKAKIGFILSTIELSLLIMIAIIFIMYLAIGGDFA